MQLSLVEERKLNGGHRKPFADGRRSVSQKDMVVVSQYLCSIAFTGFVAAPAFFPGR